MTETSSCYAIADLPRELARLTGSSPPAVSEDTTFSGIVLTKADQLCAALGLGIERGQILTVTEPVFFQPGDDAMQVRWFGQLLSKAIDQARQNGCSLVRSVQRELPTAAPNWSLKALVDLGFSLRAHVVRWTRTAAAAQNPDSLIHSDVKTANSVSLRFRSLQSADLSSNRHDLKLLLEDVFCQTNDLNSMPRPNAADLLDDWYLNRCHVFVAHHHHMCVAVCACTAESETEAVASPCEFRIQYLGVRTDYRRQGVASTMLNLLPKWLSESEDVKQETTVTLSAFADLNNQPASGLYRGCGYLPETQLGIWCRQNEQEPS